MSITLNEPTHHGVVAPEAFKQQSVEVAHQVQLEDENICISVQRGLSSNAYNTGRLSPEKEAGEHLFHRLLHQDLVTARSHFL